MIASAERMARDLASRASGERVEFVAELPPGGNNRLWRAVTASGRSVLVKRYATRHGDARLRLAREFAALELLWSRGVRCVPEPLLADADETAGVYAYLEGAALRPGGVTPADADRALAFLVRLAELARDPAAAQIGPASEAVFAPGEYPAVIERRRQALASAGDRDLETFLREEFAPVAEAAVSFAREEADRRAVPWERPAAASRTLSPSDFGFHNALRLADGTLAFVDFEYFGWDDPAKMLADVFHQPAVPLPASLRERFVRGLDRGCGCGAGGSLADRLAVFHALAGVNWCLIMLNPFRDTAGGDARAAIRRQRLAAARAKAASLGRQLRERAYPLGARP